MEFIMKKKLLIFASMVLPILAQAGDFEITVDRKRDALSAPTGNHRLVATQNWTGDVKIRNRGFKQSPELSAQYIVFVKRQRIGQKMGSDPVERVKGTIKIAAIKSGETSTVNTSEIQLHKAHMEPGWIPAEGGRENAEDSIAGIWIKLYSGTTQVGEYTSASTIPTKYKWDE